MKRSENLALGGPEIGLTARLIKFTSEEAEYWDAPGNLVSNIRMVIALATRTHPDAGEHKKVAL